MAVCKVDINFFDLWCDLWWILNESWVSHRAFLNKTCEIWPIKVIRCWQISKIVERYEIGFQNGDNYFLMIPLQLFDIGIIWITISHDILTGMEKILKWVSTRRFPESQQNSQQTPQRWIDKLHNAIMSLIWFLLSLHFHQRLLINQIF